MMKKFKLIALLLCVAAITAKAQKQCWTINPETNAIEMILSDETIPYSDHIEMSGEMVSFVTRWNIDEQKNFTQERSLVFPMLRTIPNNTHASLMYRMQTDIVSLLGVNGLAPVQLGTKKVSINGALRVVSQYGCPQFSHLSHLQYIHYITLYKKVNSKLSSYLDVIRLNKTGRLFSQ